MSQEVCAALRVLVQQRASGLCEYCLLHEDDALLSHEVDHVIATKHRGLTDESNLAWSCWVCNRLKGSDIASLDVDTGRLVRLFNPRSDAWADHFRLEEAKITPLTPEGRVTEFLLQLNRPDRLARRRLFLLAGRYLR